MDENHCRACCEELNDFQEPLFEREDGEDIKNKFQFVTGIKIQSYDQFSKALCTRCFDDTITAYDLKTRCLETEKRLINYEVLDIFTNDNQTDVVIIKTEPDFEDLVIKTEMIGANELNEYFIVDQNKKPERKTIERAKPKVKTDKKISTKTGFRCDDCGYITKTLKNLECHLQTAHVNGFECKSCEKCFQTLKNLEAHSKVCCDMRCSFKDCSYSTTNRATLRDHERRHAQTFKCAYCKYANATEQKLLTHRLSKHAETLSCEERERISRIAEANKKINDFVTCEICGVRRKSSSLWTHMNSIHGKKEFQCDFCGKITKRKYRLIRHLERHLSGRERIAQCDICKKSFFDKCSLRSHVKFIHLPTEPATCHCGKVFKRKALLERHIDQVHKRKVVEKIPCKHCGKLLASKINVKEHIIKFHTATNFICNICGRTSMSLKALKSHQRSVHEERKIICDESNCRKKFLFKNELSRHKIVAHLNLRNYKCTFPGCDKTYATNQIMQQHYKLAHDEICESCPVGNGCRFSVGRRDYMKNHLKKHVELSETEKNFFLKNIIDMNLA